MADSSEQNEHDETPAEEPQGSDEGVLWWGLPILAWAIAISLLLHGLAAAPFLIWEFAPNGDSFETEWLEDFEDLQGIGHGRSKGRWAEVGDLQQPEPEPDPEPEPEPEPEPDPESESAPEPAKEVARGPFRPDKPMPGLEAGGPSNIPSLKHYGPGNARMTGLIRIDRVRGTLYEDRVRRLLERVPDFRILAEHTGFDPVQDMDAFFMASSRPQYIQHTFLAVRHNLSRDEIKGVLDERFRDAVDWKTYGEYPARDLVPAGSRYRDPRQILLADDGLAVVARPEWLPQMTANLPDDSPLRADEAGDQANQQPAAATLLDGLAQIERAANDQKTIVMLSAQRLAYSIPGLGRMVFEGVRLAVSNPASPVLDIDLKFPEKADAAKFAKSCPALKARLKKALGLDGGWRALAAGAMGISGKLIDKLRCRADEQYVHIQGVYTAQEVRSLLGAAATGLSAHPGINRAMRDLPPPPPPEPAAMPDAGASAPDAGAAPSPDAGPAASTEQ